MLLRTILETSSTFTGLLYQRGKSPKLWPGFRDQYDVLKTEESVFHPEGSVQILMYVSHLKLSKYFKILFCIELCLCLHWRLASGIRHAFMMVLFYNNFITYVSIFKVCNVIKMSYTYSFSLKLLFFVV